MDGLDDRILSFQPHALLYPPVKDAEMSQSRWLCRNELPRRMAGGRQGGPRLAPVSHDGQKGLLGNEPPALQRESSEELRAMSRLTS